MVGYVDEVGFSDGDELTVGQDEGNDVASSEGDELTVGEDEGDDIGSSEGDEDEVTVGVDVDTKGSNNVTFLEPSGTQPIMLSLQ